jgi:hypothetical protein
VQAPLVLLLAGISARDSRKNAHTRSSPEDVAALSAMAAEEDMVLGRRVIAGVGDGRVG